jgi:hypothetical protein
VEQTEEGRFLTFTLELLLPVGVRIRIDTATKILTRIEEDNTFSEQFNLTDMEYDVFVALLGTYPQYTPREVLLSAYSGRSIEQCLRRIHDAEIAGNVTVIMSPVRNLLSRTRLKLHMIGIEATSLPDTGYMLLPYVDSWRKRRRIE